MQLAAVASIPLGAVFFGPLSGIFTECARVPHLTYNHGSLLRAGDTHVQKSLLLSFRSA